MILEYYMLGIVIYLIVLVILVLIIRDGIEHTVYKPDDPRIALIVKWHEMQEEK